VKGFRFTQSTVIRLRERISYHRGQDDFFIDENDEDENPVVANAKKRAALMEKVLFCIKYLFYSVLKYIIMLYMYSILGYSRYGSLLSYV
jgi:hypothetical protein